jgi:hypothetical protein
MPKAFQDQKRTFNKWVVMREICVIPNALALERGRSHKDAD